MTTFIIIYIIGCILAYGRFNASMHNIKMKINLATIILGVVIVLGGWMSFVSGTMIYTFEGEGSFLRFKN